MNIRTLVQMTGLHIILLYACIMYINTIVEEADTGTPSSVPFSAPKPRGSTPATGDGSFDIVAALHNRKKLRKTSTSLSLEGVKLIFI